MRIIAIIAIIAGHFVGHGIFISDVLPPIDLKQQLDFATFVLSLFMVGGHFGNVIFLLITGYFMIRKEVNWRRIALLVATMYLYYWFILVGRMIFGNDDVAPGIKEYVVGIAPFLFSQNWFVCCYIFFCLFIPYINPLLIGLERCKFQRLLMILVLLGGVLPFLHIDTFFRMSEMGLFLVAYVTGAYIRLYGLSGFNLRKLNISIALILFMYVIKTALGDALLGRPDLFNVLFGYLLAVAVFGRTLIARPFTSSLVNRVAASVLGIYLIHENDFMRHMIWQIWYPNYSYLYTDFMLAFFVIKVAVVFVCCIVIDQLRLKFYEPMMEKLLHKVWQ